MVEELSGWQFNNVSIQQFINLIWEHDSGVKSIVNRVAILCQADFDESGLKLNFRLRFLNLESRI